VPIAQKGAASGVATLDLGSKIPPVQLPDLSATYAPVSGSANYARANQLDIRAYGAVGDSKALTDATMSAGSAVLTSATGSFVSSDVGKTIYVMCGGSLLLKTLVRSVQSSTQITLATAATNASWILGGPNVNAIYGTPNAAALENALADAQAAALPAVSASRYAVRKHVLIPSGNFLIERAITPLLTSGVELTGMGQDVSKLWFNEPGALLSMDVFNATPADAYIGSGSGFHIQGLTIGSPIYAPTSFEGARVGTGVQDNGSGGARFNDVLFSGLKYGFCGAYGSDFSRFTQNVTFATCDVGSYFGPGSQQVLLAGTDYYRCREGAVFEGAPQWYMDGCSFEDPLVAAITLDAMSTGNTRSGVPVSLAGAAYSGSQVVHGTWFESNAGNSGRLAPRMVYINGDAPGTATTGGIMIRDSYFVAGGIRVGGAHNSFIEMNSTNFAVNFVDNLVIRGTFINHIARYSGTYSTCNWNISRTVPPSGASYTFGPAGSVITENGSGATAGSLVYQQITATVPTIQIMQYSSGGGSGELLKTRSSSSSSALSGIASGGALFGAVATQTLAAPGGVTIDASTANLEIVILQANATSSSITNSHKGQRLTLIWVQDSTGGRTYAWPSNCKFGGGAGPSDTTPGKSTSATLIYDGTNWIETSRSVAVG
jgi:hypothetical protein